MNPRLNAVDVPNTPIILAQSGSPVSCAADVLVNTLASIVVPKNTMGPHGRLRVTTLWTLTNSANNKLFDVIFGGAAGYMGVQIVNQASFRHQCEIFNKGATNSQGGFAANQIGFGVTTGAVVAAAADTNIDQLLTITGQKTSAGETLTLVSYLVELLSSL